MKEDCMFAGHSKLGPREKFRKQKGKKKPQALRNARKRRSQYLKSLVTKDI